ncbi:MULTISPECIES: heptaprenylglyceryl phosphate synthase [Halomicrobium]|uniref:Geranylgeranylglyceryl phosphate synthase n=2 Tax=Halomicrobium mukohataei TaxID=57705 RepID=C7NX65_HALMD|nr:MULTISPECIES: heptaprenylglyceryl phosphate synthase [Halomicrobium]ACV46430.1 geranylgeranylglyceryl phosphate synthase family protein [Halomicrobium mukohataei DSM 12286]QCD64980.1 heptaprenylglyceryl phosphate synthase [Halomicrobium mukohataei]QFR19786.1 heptaprenylglyceryl phosphate synthase [Halomicrobium sp. ZPS1]
MNLDWDDITHVTKIDPAKDLPRDIGVLSETDAIIVGGSDGVTAENTLAVIEQIGEAVPSIPILQEPYSSDHVSTDTIDAVDLLAIPAVYNGDREHFVGKHLDLFTEVGNKPEELFGTGLPVLGDLIASKGLDAVARMADKIVGEGYVIQNIESKAATVSGVETAYTTEQVAGAALATEAFYGFPIFYLEYSGTYGGPEEVEAAASHLDDATLVYGGGINSRRRAREILDAGADAIIVGDCFHEDPEQFRATVPS